MKKYIKFSLVYFLIFLLTMTAIDMTFSPGIAIGDSVTVSASVGSTISISTAGSPTNFGTLTTGSVATSNPNTTSTLTCSSGIGCQMTVYDQGYNSNPGLASTTDGYLIWSPGNDSSSTATDTLVAGSVEGYGIQATTTGSGSGDTLTLAARYNVSGDVVGGLMQGAGNAIQIASSTSSLGGREVVVTHKASITATTETGVYTDVITYSYTSN